MTVIMYLGTVALLLATLKVDLSVVVVPVTRRMCALSVLQDTTVRVVCPVPVLQEGGLPVVHPIIHVAPAQPAIFATEQA